MYEELEAIANLKFQDVINESTREVQSKLRELAASTRSDSSLFNGPLEQRKLNIRLDGADATVLELELIWCRCWS